MSDNKQESVLKSAHQIFLRFGYRRTTMSDLAKAAGISRPALYLIYPNKEAIFRAVIIRYYERAKLRSEQEIQPDHTLEEQLTTSMKIWIEDSYREIASSPEENEIYEMGYTVIEDLKESLTQLFIDQLQEILTTSSEIPPHRFQKMGLTSHAIANLMAITCFALRREAKTLQQLQSWLDDLRKLHLSALIPPQLPQPPLPPTALH